MNQVLKEKVADFANFLLTVPEFRQLGEAKVALENDHEARDLLGEVQDRQRTIMIFKASGIPVSDDQMERFQELHAKLRENALIMDFLGAREKAKRTAAAIGMELAEMLGVDFGASGCC